MERKSEYGNKNEVEEMIDVLNKSDNMAAQMAAGAYFRKLLASRRPPPLRALLASDRLIPALIGCLYRSTMPDLQLDAAWAITNIACGSQSETHQVVHHGGISALLLVAQTSPDAELCSQAIWGLGNIAADCFRCKALLRDAGLFETIALLLTSHPPQSAANYHRHRHHYLHPLRTGIWCLANLCRGGVHTFDGNLIRTIVQMMTEVIVSADFADDSELLADACWVIAYIADDIAIGLQAVLDEQRLVRQLVANLSKMDDRRVLSGSLRTIGNLITGNDEQTLSVLNHQVLPHLLKLLERSWGHIQREAAWTISNVAAGSPEHIEILFAVDGMFNALLDALFTGEVKLRKEVGWALANALTGGAYERILCLSMSGVVPALCSLIDNNTDRRLTERSLNALDAACRVDSAFTAMLRQCGGLNVVQRLILQTADVVLKEKAIRLVANFLPTLVPPKADLLYSFVRN
uniref:Importin subunit alpha n=1 Tax=Plectus sambesii TaxID=2011161 RepID=A0A914UW57_9BILA